MAKWGEGDPRWLVEERPDATNPNNWHWVEKNATPWSKNRLNQLFLGKTLTSGPLTIDLLEFTKIEGEATANNRKAKLIFLFEWVLVVKFNARVSGSDIEYNGLLEIPNLSDENEYDEVDLSVTIETKGPHEPEIRYFLSKDGLEFVRKQCEIYVQELKQEFSKGLILPTDTSKPQAISSSSKTNVVNKRDFQNKVISSATDVLSTSSKIEKVSSVKKLNLSETFKVPPERLYEILTNVELVKAWAGREATIEAKTNGSFTFISGQISGVIVQLVKNKEIVTKWRLSKYPKDHFADIKFTFKDQNDSTDLVVEAENIPEDYLNDSHTGLTRYYFQNIIRTFGIGLGLF